MSERMTWKQISSRPEYFGKWIALDHSRYDQASLQPTEGEVVDADRDLSALCARMRQSDRSSCAVRFCETPATPAQGSMPPRAPSRMPSPAPR